MLSVKLFFLFCKEQKANCVFLQETHSVLNDEKFWIIQWGDLALFAHGTLHSAGVMLLFNRFEGSVIVHEGDKEGHWLMVAVEINDICYILLCIYGYNNKVANREMLEKLGNLVNEWKVIYKSDNVIIGGDFNIAPDSWLDRKPQRSSHSVYNDIILNLCTLTNVVDYWRVSNPNSIHHTWYNPSGNGQSSRLDYWLISSELCNDVLDCIISASPLTDHCMITLSLSISKKSQISPNIWKFNNDLLKNDNFCQQVISLIEEIEKLDMSCMNKWEWFKFKVKQIAIDTGKLLSVMRKQKQKELIGEINLLAVNTQVSPENTAKLQILQSQLDELYSEKANGAYVRSRSW